MTLLREIQAAALDSTVDLADLLRKCKVLAARLKHVEFGEWVSRELNGYEDEKNLPSYRTIQVNSIGHFQGGWGAAIRNAPIPPMVLPEAVRHFASSQSFLEPVSALAAHIADGANKTLRGKWPADLVAAVQDSMYENYVLADAWRQIPGAAIKGILDTIRTRVLDFVLAIEEKDPAAGDGPPGEAPKLAAGAVTQIFHTTIHSGQANIGTSGNARVKSGDVVISIETAKPLLHELRSATEGLQDEGDRAEAQNALAKVEEELAQPKPRLERVKSYLDLYATLFVVVPPTLDLLRRMFGIGP
jgi:hypothetical protein